MLTTLDWAIVTAYFVAVFAVAVVMTRRETTRSSAQGYFLGGRDSGWFVIGASLFASNIGSEHLIGLAGTGAASGVAVSQFELLASLILLILGWVFVPFYLGSGVFTMPEFLERRYNATARWYLAVISIVGYVLTKISVTIAAGGIVFETLMGIDFWTGALIVVVITGIYTIFGGLRAVLYTDLLQMFVLIGGAVAVTVIGVNAIGGWGVMYETAGSEFFDLWKPASHPDFPWTGILLGAPILGVWYWCTDQFIVQRVLSAKNLENARRGTIFAAFLKILPLFIFVIPGVIAYTLTQQGEIALGSPDEALADPDRHAIAGGVQGPGGCGAAGCADEFVILGLQLVLDLNYVGHLQETAPGGQRASPGAGRANLHRRTGRIRLAVDSDDETDFRSDLSVPAERASLHFSADCRGFFTRCILATGKLARCNCLSGSGIHTRHWPADCRTQ